MARRLGSRRRNQNQSPCLLYSSAAGDPAPYGSATLRRLSTGQLRRVALPDPPLRGRFVVGSSHGWLATADERSDLLLVNPLTGAQIALPSPLTIKNVRGRYSTDGALQGFDLMELNLETQDCDAKTYDKDLPLDEGRFYFYVRVAMSGDPSSSAGNNNSCVVVILHMPRNHVSFARVGDTRWTWIDMDWRCNDYTDVFYDDSDGLFYAVVDTGDVHTIDLNGTSPVVKEILRPITSEVSCYNKYIVRAPWGDILQIWRYDYDKAANCKDGRDERRTLRLEVYTVDVAEQKLTEITDLQDHVLFIGFNTPLFVPAKDDYPMLTPNCVYATEDSMSHIYCSKFGPHQLAVFNMTDGTCTDLFQDDRNSWLQWPLPIWIRPSFSQDRYLMWMFKANTS
ncbi:unnamed protein product [Urochloa decumbens]|uniref:KIB1-4 beta-propeller domain-containing protein n=1 Tax=Urochloa decumbens TaxID=240449 RepID=A0ABC8YWM7_9POAL